MSPSSSPQGSERMVTIPSANIRGLSLSKDRTKPDQLGDMAREANSVAIALTETWLSPQHEDAEISIPGFALYRADRASRARGGAAIYLREDIAAVPILEYSCDTVEVLALKARALEAILYVVYWPPVYRSLRKGWSFWLKPSHWLRQTPRSCQMSWGSGTTISQTSSGQSLRSL